MLNRYIMARTKGREAYEQAVEEDRALLAHFGLRLMSVDGCIRAAVERELRGKAVNPWNVIELNAKTWDWLRPILVAARDNGKAQELEPLLRLAAK